MDTGVSMGRWFLSYNSQDPLHQQVQTRLGDLLGADIFYAPASLRAGGYWLPILADEINKAGAFILLIGEKGLGPWQVLEYYEAFDRRVKQPGNYSRLRHELRYRWGRGLVADLG